MSDVRQPRIPKTAATILLVAAGASLAYVSPGLARFRPVRPERAAVLLASPFDGKPTVPLTVRVVREPEEPTPPAPAPAAPAAPGAAGAPQAPRARRPGLGAVAEEGPQTDLEDPTGQLDRFFEKLERTEKGEPGAVTRISHFGDSPLTGDLISGDARSRLQAAFGDAGHGFILIGRPWAWYGHRKTTVDDSGWRVLCPLLEPGNGGYHGLAGVTFTSRGGAKSEIGLEKTTFTKLSVTFTRLPGGGTLLVTVDGGEPEAVSTAGPARETAEYARVVPGGGRKVALRAKGDGEVAVHGVVLENDGPGLVYDALGANGGSVRFLSLLDAASWEKALALRGSDLVVLGYGTNESGTWGVPGPRYRHDYATVVERVRRALPEAGILLVAPMDRGMRSETGDIVTMPTIPKIVEAQRQAARENGVAFFDTFTAMGGEGTMARWYESEPRLVTGDFTHTTFAGSARVAKLLVGALGRAYEAWKKGRAAEPAQPEPTGTPGAPPGGPP